MVVLINHLNEHLIHGLTDCLNQYLLCTIWEYDNMFNDVICSDVILI